MLLRLNHSNLRVREGAVLLTTHLLGIVGGVVRGDLGRSHHRGRAVLLAAVESAGWESILWRSGWLGCWSWACGTLGHIANTAVG